ncbi:MAG: NAD(P)/FAD-dependent oxidoreductase [Pseudonocardia sp.]
MPDLPNRVDVLICGGGIAGLTLALQLRQTIPDLDVVVVEKQAHPVREAAHKVGESSVEIQAHYLRDVLGLRDHLEADQLRKFGLRMFFSEGTNDDIARRIEYGQISEAPLPSYQLDRGRLENRLREIVTELGVTFVDARRVGDIQLGHGEEEHTVLVEDVDGSGVVRSRWLVDATGRAGLLKRKLGLARSVDHHANAAWLRVDHAIDVETWSDDPEWRSRVDGGKRRLSTNHLMGRGYWVWLIPLASGATSIGIVAEDSAHTFDGFNTLERALKWLDEHEPQVAAEVRDNQDRVQDFRVMRDYAYGCLQVYSEDRWCLTGEAGVSIDPLYSSGGDLMAISNGLITDLVYRDRAGEDVAQAAVVHNQVYLVLSEIWLVAYQNQYPVMGNARVMVAKVIWDTAIYWAVPGLLAFHDTYRTIGERPAVFAALQEVWLLHARVQRLLREWNELDDAPVEATFADPYTLLDFIVDLHNGMAAGLSDEELDEQVVRNVELLEQLAGQLVATVAEHLAASPSAAARAQVGTWRSDPLLSAAVDRFHERRTANPIDPAWITLGGLSTVGASS